MGGQLFEVRPIMSYLKREGGGECCCAVDPTSAEVLLVCGQSGWTSNGVAGLIDPLPA